LAFNNAAEQRGTCADSGCVVHKCASLAIAAAVAGSRRPSQIRSASTPTSDSGWKMSKDALRAQAVEDTPSVAFGPVAPVASGGAAPRLLSEFCPNSQQTEADLSVRQLRQPNAVQRKRPKSLGLIDVKSPD